MQLLPPNLQGQSIPPFSLSTRPQSAPAPGPSPGSAPHQYHHHVPIQRNEERGPLGGCHSDRVPPYSRGNVAVGDGAYGRQEVGRSRGAEWTGARRRKHVIPTRFPTCSIYRVTGLQNRWSRSTAILNPLLRHSGKVISIPYCLSRLRYPR